MKKKIIIILITLGLIFLACVGIGRYFVGYALSPASHSDERNVEGSVEINFDEQERKEEALASSFSQKITQTSIQSDDHLKLNGYYTLKESSHMWAIMIHGYKSSYGNMLSYGARYDEQGYNVLLPENRAHDNSEGNYIGMGWLDKEDIKNWIDWIIKQDSQAQIVLHGVSMGGATVMMLSGDQPEHVIGYIEDCGYTSVWDIFASELDKRFSLPTFPVLDISNIYARFVAGYDFKEASSLKQVEKCQKPMLFIHGDQDDFVPTEMVYEVYEAAQCEKELYIVEGAGHAQAKLKNPQDYWNHVFTFIHQKMMNE